MPLRSVVFLDRDGVINYERKDYVKRLSEFEFIEGALEALEELKRCGLGVVVVTNQSAVGRGLLTESELARIHEFMVSEIRRHMGDVLGVFHCPHRPDEGCACRKPRTMLFERASTELGISLKDSWFIGDRESDMEAGNSIGCRTIVVSPNTPGALQTAARSVVVYATKEKPTG